MKEFDPATCIHTTHGYSLFMDAGKPVVVRVWNTRRKMKDGRFHVEPHREIFALDGDRWPMTATGMKAREELRKAAKEWIEWNAAMKGI